jgi:Fic family protein
MQPIDFVNADAGKLVEIGNGFHAFIPAPVPRELPLPPRLARTVGDTRAKLGRLNEGVRALPSPELFLRPFQKREAVLSSRIEGTVTTLDEAFLSAAVEADEELVDDDREVSNYERALRTGVEALANGRELNLPLLQALHQELLRGVRGEDKQPGMIRTRQAFVANRTVQVPDDSRFVPPPALHLPDCLDDLNRYLAERGPDEGLIRIALAHYQFETIHPFADGNGRTGRLLVALQMVWEGVLDQPFLYVSPMLERRRQEYYDGLLRASQQGAFLEWIDFFVGAVSESATETLDRLTRLRALAADFESRLRKQQSQKPILVARQLLAFPYITVSIAKDLLGVPQSATAQQAIDKLVAAGILELMDYRPKVSRGRPPKLYRCSAVLDIIRE